MGIRNKIISVAVAFSLCLAPGTAYGEDTSSGASGSTGTGASESSGADGAVGNGTAGSAMKHGCLSAVDSPVHLVLQITVDQLRGDLPSRFKSRFGQGGFRYLMDRGTNYVNAHYNHADTETGPGHATLATGAHPAQHGIVAGEWWDAQQKKEIYSVEDPRYMEFVDEDHKLVSKPEGRAPTNLLSTTIGDEMFIASEERSKVFAVAGKDRSAILPGGRTGKAFWLSDGVFTTTSYYYDKPPDWVLAWNGKKLADSYKDKSWNLLQDPKSYLRIDKDDKPYEGFVKHLGRTMPKKLGSDVPPDFYKALESSIANDELVLSFTKELIAKENLGRNEAVDYLSISFSSTDYVGHVWGVGSLEAEDNMIRLDRTLANLFDYIDKNVGLNKTLIVLSADHGVSEVVEYMQTLRFPAKRVDPADFEKHLNDGMKKRFGVDGLLASFMAPYLFLDEEKIRQNGLKLDAVEREAARVAMDYPGIEFACTRNDIEENRLSPTQKRNVQIMNTFHRKRSGHVHLVNEQHVNLVQHPWHKKAGLHGSVWSYDTFVPIMFAGPGVQHQQVARLVGPHDIAPTIATFLGIKAPSGAVGQPLVEVLEGPQ